MFPLMTWSWNTFLSLLFFSIYDNCRALFHGIQVWETLCIQKIFVDKLNGRFPSTKPQISLVSWSPTQSCMCCFSARGFHIYGLDLALFQDLQLLNSKLNLEIQFLIFWAQAHTSHLFSLTNLVFQVLWVLKVVSYEAYNVYSKIS